MSNTITKDALKERTKQFALQVMQTAETLPKTTTGRIIADQLIRSGTSVGANYRSACRARSTKDFINKLGITIEESDESGYWIELIVEARLLPKDKVSALWREANELTAIFTASHKTATINMQRTVRKSKNANQKSEISNQK